MSETITITLPMPPKVLTPNGRPFSRRGMIGKAVAAKKQRQLAHDALDALQLDTLPWPAVSCKYVFYHAVKRRRDDDNYIAAMKAARDGLVQAGLVHDDDSTRWRTEGAEFRTDPKQKRCEIVLTRVDD